MNHYNIYRGIVFVGSIIHFFPLVLLCSTTTTATVVAANNNHHREEEENDNLDCEIRRLGYQTAKRALSSWQKDDDLAEVYDALEIETKCPDNVKIPRNNKKENDDDDTFSCSSETPDTASTTTFHVCPQTGNDDDNNNGIEPFATLERAIEATRRVRKNTKGIESVIITILLYPGIHFLNQTIVLTSQDSFLTIKAASCDEKPWISGGILLNKQNTNWKRNNKNNNIWMTDVDADDITGLFTIKPHQRMTLARYPNANVEDWNAPNRYVSSNKVIKEWLFPPFAKSNIPKMVTIDLSKENNPVGIIKNDSSMEDYNKYGTGVGGVCGTVWKSDYPSYWCGNVSAGGWAEVDRAAALAGRLNIPRGMVLNSQNDYDDDSNYDDNNYYYHYDDNSTLTSSNAIINVSRWKHYKGAIVHVAHTQGWAWHMFNISSIIRNKILFDKGGWQGGRNWQCLDANGHLSNCNGDDKRLHGGDWYVEGILEELDEPGEFYYDKDRHRLYFYPNTTTTMDKEKDYYNTIPMVEKRRRLDSTTTLPPDVIATKLQTLFSIRGTQLNPVQNISILGIGFRDAAKTYMEQWAAPSGGDWALHRGGAIHIEGARFVNIQRNHFRRLDGNAILLGGYTRHVTISQNEFGWIGNGAVATWGNTVEYDATGGAQPRFSVMEQNLIHDVGLYQKQSSGWGQNKACQSVIRNNIMYNLPRAAINFNDGLGGDNVVEGNVIFNACRESGDHGPINSWDRMPFLSDLTGNFTSLPTTTRRNFIIANYGASEGFDNDDGSSFYYTHDNVFYAADGFKMDYGGHDSKFYHNLVITSNTRKHCYGSGSFRTGHSDLFEHNICILNKKEDTTTIQIGHTYQCSTDGLRLQNNTYYITIDGNGTFGCGNDGALTLQEMQQNVGLEIGSSIHNGIPTTHRIISWAKRILQFSVSND